MTAASEKVGGPGARLEAARLVEDARRLLAAGDLARAAPVLQRALALDDENVEAVAAYAWLALQARQPRAALAAAARWAALDPRSGEARNLLGVASRQCGDLAQAIAILRDAVALEPLLFDAHVNLANALREAGDTAGALDHYQRALAIRPDSAAVCNNLGNLYRDLREAGRALEAYRRAVAIDPAHAGAHGNIGNVLRDAGRLDEAIAAHRRALALAPDDADTWSNLLLALDSSDAVGAEALADEHRAFGRHFGARIQPLAAVAARPRAPRERLRVGYVSADFCRHAAARFLQPLIRAHDRQRVEVFCYYNRARGDDATAGFRDLSEHFLPVAGMTDAELAARIRADGVELLVDLNGHTAGNRLPLFFLRPAPVQVTWLGYLGPSGVPTIDWRISDDHADPRGLADAAGLERVWRLPRTMWCYEPYAEAPGVSPLPALRADGFTFGALNNPGKVTPSTLSAWIDVLRRVADARLMLVAPADDDRLAQLFAAFAAGGIDASRVVPVRRAGLADYLALHARIDVALDTFPYAGGATTCDALWMGVPVVTLASGRPFGRSGASILAQLGLDHLVARTPAGYVDAAVGLARDREGLARLRAELRPRMRASPLLDAPAFARDFEDALFAMAAGRGDAR